MAKSPVLPTDASTCAEWVDLVRADQLRRWPRGERILVEEYLAACSRYGGEASAILDILYQEVVLRDELGDAPTASEYVKRFPKYAARIRRQFAIHAALADEKLAEVTVATPTVPPRKSDPPPPLTHQVPLRPTRFAQPPGYSVLGEVGRGRLGVVYKARQIGQDRIVALRILPPGDSTIDGAALTRVRHANVVQVLDVGISDGIPFVASEYVVGGTLAEKIRGRPVPPAQAARLLARIACGVAAAHAVGVVHGDLRPSHVLLQSSAGPTEGPKADEAGKCQLHYASYVPKVADFGMTRRSTAMLAEVGPSMGVAAYLAPEQARNGQPSVASDIHALGAILYEALTGRAPFLAPTADEALQTLQNDQPVLPSRFVPGVPSDLEYVSTRCLAKDPAQRYASAADVATDLQRHLANEPLRPSPDPIARVVEFGRRRSGTFASALLAAVAFASALAMWWRAESRVVDEIAQRELAETRLYAAAVAQASAVPSDHAKSWLDHCPERLRGWEWYHLARGGRIERTALDSQVQCLAVSTDGTTLAAGCENGSIAIVDAADGKVRSKIQATAGVTAIAFASDVKSIAAVVGSDGVQCFDLARKQLQGDPLLTGRIAAIAGRRQGDFVACETDRVVLCGTNASPPTSVSMRATCLAVRPDGMSVAVAGDGSSPSIWLIGRLGEQPRRPTEPASNRVVAIAYATDGTWLATAGGSADAGTCELIVWDATTLDVRHRIRRTGSPWLALAIHPEGRRIATANEAGEVVLWDAVSGLELATLRGPKGATGLAFADRGRRLYLAGSNVPLVSWISQ